MISSCRYGPLCRTWCMRNEAKNHYFKLMAHTVRNYKNVAKALANRHQQLTCKKVMTSI